MPIISISGVSKTYASGFQALKSIDLEIRRGEIFALLGPNGAGKTTLIGIVCGIVTASAGTVTVDGHDIVTDYRAARSLIGLVPQELHTDAFETVWATTSYSRGLFGKRKNPAHIEKVLKDLSLFDKKDSQIITLSGGMKRRVLIAKALAHEPQILFLDEPTAGVDVELRKDMWQVVRTLRASGVTVILTTHYIEEAEEMADRVGVINKGEIILVEEKAELMRKLGKKQLTLQLQKKLDAVPAEPRAPADAFPRRPGAHLQLRHAKASAPASRRCSTNCAPRTSASRTCARRRARWKRSSSAWCSHESSGGPRNLPVRDGAHRAHAAAEHRVAGAVDLALFRGVRRRDRLAHHRDRRRALRHVHRARPDHADAADAERRQRLVRHLFSALHRHDLRAARPRRCRRSRSCSAMWARRRPSRSSSA